jgi:fructuronate reductase
MAHLGVGAFARGHVLWCTQLALGSDSTAWPVHVVAQKSRSVVDALRAHGWAYEVELRDVHGSNHTKVDVVTDGIIAADEPERLAALLSAPELKVVTVTATEAGYPCDPRTRRLDHTQPGVTQDLEGPTPGTVVGQIVRAAAARVRGDAGPVSFVVCDNVLHGGDLLRDLAIELAQLSGDDDAAAWLADHASFPNAVVDRVVPAVPEHRQPKVLAEPWFRWVLQDAFSGPRPRWELGGAQLVDDIAPWQSAKLHLVNAPHSLLAYLGLACGHATVHEAVNDDLLNAAAEAALRREFIPAVPRAEGLSAIDDAEASLRRFANSAVPHRSAQVGSGGSVKLSQRLTAVIEDCVGRGQRPTWSTAAVAGWANAVTRGWVDEPRAGDVRAALERPSPDRPRALLETANLPLEDVAVDDLVKWLDAFEHDDVRSAVRDALKDG